MMKYCISDEERESCIIFNGCTHVVERLYYGFDQNDKMEWIVHLCKQEDYEDRRVEFYPKHVVAGKIEGGSCRLCREVFDKDFIDNLKMYGRMKLWEM